MSERYYPDVATVAIPWDMLIPPGEPYSVMVEGPFRPIPATAIPPDGMLAPVVRPDVYFEPLRLQRWAVGNEQFWVIERLSTGEKQRIKDGQTTVTFGDPASPPWTPPESDD